MQEDDLGRSLLSEISALKTKRQVIEDIMKESANLLYPLLIDIDGTLTEDSLFASKHYSGKPKSYLEIAANALTTNTMSPSVDWLQLGMASSEVMSDRASLEYFEIARKVIMESFYVTDIYRKVRLLWKYGQVQGTAFLYDGLGSDDKTIEYILWHPGDTFVELGPNSRPTKIALRQKMLVSDIVGRQSFYEPTKEMVDEAKSGAEKEYNIWVYIRKNREGDYIPGFDNSKAYSVFHVVETGDVLYESPADAVPGVLFQPEPIPRMDYSWCKGFHIYREALQNNRIRKLLMKETNEILDPALMVPISDEPFSRKPGATNFIIPRSDGFVYPKRIIDPVDLSTPMLILNEIDQSIRTIFMVDFYTALTSKTNRKTAQEVSGLMNEMGSLVIPDVIDMERNILSPLVRHRLWLLMSLGRLDEPSNMIKKHMKESGLTVEFLGVLSQAQRYSYTVGKNLRAISEVFNPVYQQMPDIYDWVNQEGYINSSLSGLGCPTEMIRTSQEVSSIRQARIQMRAMAEQQQQAMELMTKGAKSAEQGSPAEKIMSEEANG
jgi:hypothetical protein